jgi:hypothetical protein
LYPVNKLEYVIPPDFTLVLHEDSILGFSYPTLPQLSLPINTSLPETYQAAAKLAKHPVHSVTLMPQSGLGDPITLPIWVFNYWREIRLAMLYRSQWKAALVWLQSYSGFSETTDYSQKVLMALSFFPWSGNNASVKDITSLLAEDSSESYLSSYHIDHMIERISASYRNLYGPEVSKRHIMTTVDILEAITKFYGSQRMPTKAGNALWEKLMVIENQIIQGGVDSVSGVYYLPLHWVSVIFDIQMGCIHYGDSAGGSLRKLEHQAFTKWIQHLKRRSGYNINKDQIPVHQLPTGYQNDVTSCGLFALNAIGHHYMNQLLLHSDQVSVAYSRMEIALDILQEKTVCAMLIFYVF